jgi:hypothetical protein
LRAGIGGTSARNALLVHLCRTDPAEAVKHLVLSNGNVTRFIADAIQCPIEEATDADFSERVLWKLGFDIPRYSNSLPTLRNRLEFFGQEVLSAGGVATEKERERIRSAGVNLFVSIEEFIQELIRYNVWVFGSDHFLGTEFTYESGAAMLAVQQHIGTSIGNGDVAFTWSLTGENTLGALLAYLQQVARWLKSLSGRDGKTVIRSSDDLPHYADDKFRIFPFRHVELWGDSDTNSLKRISDQFENICHKLSKSNLASVRNGLDHQRLHSNFPSFEALLAFVAVFREGLDLAEHSLFYPIEHWAVSSNVDRYGRRETVLVDYAGRQRKVFGPSPMYPIGPRLNQDTSFLLAPGNPLGLANFELIFRPRSASVYSKYWDGYPRRRHIPPLVKEQSVEAKS